MTFDEEPEPAQIDEDDEIQNAQPGKEEPTEQRYDSNTVPTVGHLNQIVTGKAHSVHLTRDGFVVSRVGVDPSQDCLENMQILKQLSDH